MISDACECVSRPRSPPQAHEAQARKADMTHGTTSRPHGGSRSKLGDTSPPCALNLARSERWRPYAPSRLLSNNTLHVPIPQPQVRMAYSQGYLYVERRDWQWSAYGGSSRLLAFPGTKNSKLLTAKAEPARVRNARTRHESSSTAQTPSSKHPPHPAGGTR